MSNNPDFEPVFLEALTEVCAVIPIVYEWRKGRVNPHALPIGSSHLRERRIDCDLLGKVRGKDKTGMPKCGEARSGSGQTTRTHGRHSRRVGFVKKADTRRQAVGVNHNLAQGDKVKSARF